MTGTDRFCGVEATLALVGGQWKPRILWCLREGTQRFGDVTRHLGGASPKMLTQQLRALEEDGLISRKVYPEVPPRVEYDLTERGASLIPLLTAMDEWGRGNQDWLEQRS